MDTSITLIALLAIGLTGCSEELVCAQVDRPPVTDPQTELFIGGTYGEALDVIVGTRSGPMQWGTSSVPSIEGMPAPGETQITVTVYEPSEAEQIELVRESAPPNDRGICMGWVEADRDLGALRLPTDPDTTLGLRLTYFGDPERAAEGTLSARRTNMTIELATWTLE